MHSHRAAAYAILFATLCAGYATLGRAAAAAEVKWYNAADDDQNQIAQAELMVVYFNADWCGYCTKLKEQVFNTPSFHALAGKALFVSVDDKNDERSNRISLEEKLKIESYPTLVVLKRMDQNFNEVGRVLGFLPADEYLAQLRPLLGVKNPPADKLPDTFAGLGLTPDSNLCKPGDFQCLIGKTTSPGLGAFKNFNDLLKPVPTIAATPTELRQVLTEESLAVLIKSINPAVETISTLSNTTYRFTEKDSDGWEYPIDAALSSNRSKLWITLTVGTAKSSGELPAEKLLKLLEFNNSYGPTHFTMVDGKLMLTRPLDNLGISKLDLSYAISELKRATRETAGVWQELRNK